MGDAPWLTIIGLGEDGPEGLSAASRSALASASIIMGPPRHLALVTNSAAKMIEWPVPFAKGVDDLMASRGQKTVVLASGDPFWFGAGTVLANRLNADEWQAFPGSSTFSLAANRLGWALEHSLCFGLHATPISKLRPHLAPKRQIITLLRDGDAVADLASYLIDMGFGASQLTVFEALGGPNETQTVLRADALNEETFKHPICVAATIQGSGTVVPSASGIPDDLFENDGQMTKRPVRALTLSALTPKPFEHLWDIGGGSGSIAIEWLLSHSTVTATSIEPRPDRAERIMRNADTLGVSHLNVITGKAMDVVETLPNPDAVFVGGGLDQPLLDWLLHSLEAGTRIVINAVTLETEALLVQAQKQSGGHLMRFEMSQVTEIGSRTGWKSQFPIVQWSVVL
ncbi:MAG: precorrin-6y C5,15-methyltransferase (decarboxylating) subunit CbiE [Paracoccaceae bacterium]